MSVIQPSDIGNHFMEKTVTEGFIHSEVKKLVESDTKIKLLSKLVSFCRVIGPESWEKMLMEKMVHRELTILIKYKKLINTSYIADKAYRNNAFDIAARKPAPQYTVTAGPLASEDKVRDYVLPPKPTRPAPLSKFATPPPGTQEKIDPST